MVDAILFDKDGTLFDFEKTWGVWALDFLTSLAEGDAGLLTRLGAAIGFDVATARFDPASPVIAGTPEESVKLLSPLLPAWDQDALLAHGNAEAEKAALVEVVPLSPFLSGLRSRGLALGVATNDSERAARAHLARSEISHLFDAVIGSDSGYGGKPAPQMVLGFCAQTGIAAEKVVMVGDSTHDLHAGRAAGMVCIGVLTGPARHEDLAPHADAVLASIAELPAWLDQQRRERKTTR